MFDITSIFTWINAITGSGPFLLSVFAVSCCLKLYILVKVIIKQFQSRAVKRSYLFIILMLLSSLVSDGTWILQLIRKLFFSTTGEHVYTLFMRFAWAALILQYHSFALFLESLVEPNIRFYVRHIIFMAISFCLMIIFSGIGLYDFIIWSPEKRDFLFPLMELNAYYCLFPLLLSSVWVVFQKIRSESLPRILTKQLSLFMVAVIAPYWLFDFMQIYPFNLSATWINTGYNFASLSNLFLIGAVFYCSRKMLGLRFLNFSSHVQSRVNADFMGHFKTSLEQFSHVTNVQELHHITQAFFKDTFQIPHNRTSLFIRSTTVHDKQLYNDREKTFGQIESFMNTHDDATCDYIKKHKILMYDELVFSHFYEPTPMREGLVQFLDEIQADIFIPIYDKQRVIGYITLDRFARRKELYSNAEHDEMLMFASYLGNIINLMQHKNFDVLVHQEKVLQEELYSKHQEVNQYKESIRSFLRSNQQKDIGIIFYKNRRFTFGNQSAKEFIGVNPNQQEGHPLSQELKRLAVRVEQYKAPHTVFVKDKKGEKLVFAAIPSLEKNNIIISVYYPEISDVIKKQIDILKDPSEWDYLLYLESTKSGKLINQLIPGSGETLLNFKIELLKTALHKKATLLNTPEKDSKPLVELLHHISLRETLYTLELSKLSTNFDVAIKLFGINSIFGIQSDKSPPLLEKLDGVGTLFIKNIHLLDLETQEYLAEFIKYGLFRVFKSDQKIVSNVRIICSSTQDLKQLVQDKKFSVALFNELVHTTLTMPSLVTLPDQELQALAQGLSEQAVSGEAFKNVLTLTDKDKTKLTRDRPASLQELKDRIQVMLVQKSKKNDIYQEAQFDPGYEMSDPELVQASRLGKQALKDHKTMVLLWSKFKNQNKIAALLGVNRSSVNRRLKQYNLQ